MDREEGILILRESDMDLYSRLMHFTMLAPRFFDCELPGYLLGTTHASRLGGQRPQILWKKKAYLFTHSTNYYLFHLCGRHCSWPLEF